MNNREAMERAFEANYKPHEKDFSVFDVDDCKDYTNPNTEKAYAGFVIGYQAALASQAQQEPNKDVHEAIILLSAVFDAWENGTDCYDDFDGVSGSFIGKAFNLDDEIFTRCCDLLNRVNPPRNASQAQQTESKPVMPVGFLDHGGIFYSYREKIKDGTELYVKSPAPEGGDK